MEVHYPIGHLRRREEGIPVLLESQVASNLATQFDPATCQSVIDVFENASAFDELSVDDFMGMLFRQPAESGTLLA